MRRTQEHDEPNSAYRRFEAAAEWPMLVLSLVFIGLLIGPELTDVESAAIDLGLAAIWGLFAIEVLILFGLAPSKRRMIREHWLDIVIVVAPFLRPLRIGRVVRVVRTGGIVGRSITGFAAVVQRKGLQAYGAITIGLVVASAGLVYAFEKDAPGSNITNFADALWWAAVTTTTVGYGDHAPVTTDGRAIAVLLMVVGIGLVGVVTANVAAYFVEREQADEMTALREQLDRIESLLVSNDR